MSETSIFPGKEYYLIDNNPETCTAFNISYDGRSQRFIQFRFRLPNDVSAEVNVSLIGVNLGCGQNLYVSPLSDVESNIWTGRWTTCSLLRASVSEGQESCSYRCDCTKRCKEMQILKIHRTTEDSSLIACHASLKYEESGIELPLY